MTDTLTPIRTTPSFGSRSTPRSSRPSITWVSPGDDLWVASLHGDDGTTFLGFVELSLDEFLAVSGEGESLGRFPDLRSAQAAFDAALPRTGADRAWSRSGATVVKPSRLRLR